MIKDTEKTPIILYKMNNPIGESALWQHIDRHHIGRTRAMLKIPKYKHESRSVEAIMDMSILTKAKKWEQSFLPPKEQLKLHLDETQFLRYMMRDAIFSEKIDVIAQLIREKLNVRENAIPCTGDDTSLPWKKLGESQKDFYRDHVKSIPDVLLLIQYDVMFVDAKTENLAFSEDELKELSRFEYKRRKNGKQAKTQACVLSTEETKTQVFQMVGLWAVALAESNFKLERLKFANPCNML